MRLFIALNLRPDVRADIASKLLGPLRQAFPGVRWVREETLHVTLLFLGERSEAEAQRVADVLLEVAAVHPPLAVSLRGVGVFSRAAKPRVVWLGLAPPNGVLELYESLIHAAAPLGVRPEARPYTPHITLGRVPDRAASRLRLMALPALPFEAAESFTSVDLMASELTPQGPRYTRLAFAPLAMR